MKQAINNISQVTPPPRQAMKSYAIDPAHTNDSHAIDRARSNRLRIVSVCGGYNATCFSFAVIFHHVLLLEIRLPDRIEADGDQL